MSLDDALQMNKPTISNDHICHVDVTYKCVWVCACVCVFGGGGGGWGLNFYPFCPRHRLKHFFKILYYFTSMSKCAHWMCVRVVFVYVCVYVCARARARALACVCAEVRMCLCVGCQC